MRFLVLSCFCFLNLSIFSQDEGQVKLRYWNGATDGVGVTNPVGLSVSANRVPVANALIRVNEATLFGEEPKFYFMKKFALFFTVKNVSDHNVAIYDWAFKAICPRSITGIKNNVNSSVSLVTPYIPSNIYIILKPGERKQFFSAENDFFWCLPSDKDDLLKDPEFFQALVTCASIKSSTPAANPNQKEGIFLPPITPPQKPENELDPELLRIIKDHNELIHKNQNDKSESLRNRIIKITKSTYPELLKIVESKLLKTQNDPRPPLTESGTLSFNGRTMKAEGVCVAGTASLSSVDLSAILIINNLGDNGTFSVSEKYYTNGCMGCLAVQFQDMSNSKTYIAVSGVVSRTAQIITIDVTVKEMLSVIEGGGSGYKVAGNIILE